MNLKNLRINNNLRQEDVAKIINKSSVAYGYYETGSREPDIKTLITLANYFDVSLDYLCGRTWNNKIGYIPDNRKDLITQLLALSDAEFNEIAIYVKGYIAGKSKQQTINFYTPDEI